MRLHFVAVYGMCAERKRPAVLGTHPPTRFRFSRRGPDPFASQIFAIDFFPNTESRARRTRGIQCSTGEFVSFFGSVVLARSKSEYPRDRLDSTVTTRSPRLSILSEVESSRTRLCKR